MRTRPRGCFPSVLLLAALMLLTGCAASSGLTCATPTANASTGTASTTTITTESTHGSVLLLTDHSIYAPGETIGVTFVNHLPAALTALVPFGCPLFGLQRQVGDTWQPVPVCPPPPPPGGGDAPPPSYQSTGYIPAGWTVTDHITDDIVPPGTYRVVGQFGTLFVYSSPIRFCTCGQCA